MKISNKFPPKFFCEIVIVRTRFAAQAQDVWDLGPVSPVQ